MKLLQHLLTVSVFLLCLAPSLTLATTWAPADKVDPISGDKITVRTIASYGSYIYSWPSKYDLVFWPLTDENWIWMNPKSGYAAFGGDFEKLSAVEKKNLKKWLEANHKPGELPGTHEEKLYWLETVYKQRQMDDEFWSIFYRLMAYIHMEDKKKSIVYVKKALPLLKKKLYSQPSDFERIECLYLIGEYHRRLGENDIARQYFAQVKAQKYKDKDGKEQIGHPYFLGMIRDIENRMMKGSPNK